MKVLEERIAKDGVVIGSDILKVSSFLNHQMDVKLFNEMADEWYRLFEKEKVTKILTIEASGIGLAVIAAQKFGCPVVFAKKSKSSNVNEDVYATRVTSFTHGTTFDVIVSKDFLSKEDRVLILDDFLATGEALKGLLDIVHQSGATPIGCGIAIEKAFQPGGKELRNAGIRIESLAKIKSMTPKQIEFC